VENSFRYGLFLVYIDLAELDRAFAASPFWSADRFNLACFLRKDHFGDPRTPLDKAVRDLVKTKTGESPSGPIRMLCHFRYFGHCFNPDFLLLLLQCRRLTPGDGRGRDPQHPLGGGPLLRARRSPEFGCSAVSPVSTAKGISCFALHGHGHALRLAVSGTG